MDNIKRETMLWVHLFVLLGIWVALLYVTNTPLAINWDAIKRLPDVISIYVVLSLAFTKWMWRWPIFRGWLVPFPDLEGTWVGELQSTWKNPETGQRIPPLRMIVVVRQTFSSVSCTLFTRESESHSTAAQITRDGDSGAIRLDYTYTNRSKATLRIGSPIHDGAARLKVVSLPDRALQGEYWTSRCTTGDMVLRFFSSDLLDAFSDMPFTAE
jgi:hypothetical protein